MCLFTYPGGNLQNLGVLDGVDMWQALSTGEPSPRAEILHNIDNIDGTAALRYMNFKLVVGSSGRVLDSRHEIRGESRAYEDLELLLEQSKAAAVLRRFYTGKRRPTLRGDSWRRDATTSCGESTQENFAFQEPYYLFDVGRDPCELHNMAGQRPMKPPLHQTPARWERAQHHKGKEVAEVSFYRCSARHMCFKASLISISAPEWTPGETKLLLDYYYKYFPQVGPFKKFKNKKMLFKQVSQDLADVLGCSKTPQQCENRIKTVRRQKRKACDNNNTSGAQPCPVPFDDEMRKIESIDDSLEPEVQRDSYGATYKATSSSSDSSSDVPSTSPEISSTLASGSDSGQSTKGPADAKKRELRASTSRMQQMQYFFDQMRAISAELAARREELEKENGEEARRAAS
ncbi:hypothetical protein HPB48_006353 [Haemaphysalis longicornis]|uniref:Myb/SANT-like DNA-binding domain-containing protein n=1 Tax=Haemaphysalis longicornis TaxID=44386 RepID=A0A9J6GWB3_HAELO|nr:hypothetical protein HPB48_006353 [Haemaphysalis longicornis]